MTAAVPVRAVAAADVAAVEALVAEAAAEDGTGPLSEDGALRLRALAPAEVVPGELAAGVVHLVSTAHGAPGTVTGYVQVDTSAPGDASGELVVSPRHRRGGAGRALLGAARAAAGGPLRLWAHGDLPPARALAAAAGLRRVRELSRMARPLGAGAQLPPAEPPAGTALRTFRPGADDAAWLALNAAAFAHHPEQGRWSTADLLARQREPWFDPAGFFLAEADGALVGFHWTKVEPGSRTGEVYVLGVAPGRAGRGLGRVLAVAGLRHLAARGCAEVDLYVDGDNAAAVRLYSGLGFARAALDVQYRSGD
ncbi:mycothiol synthase [Kineococcus xinjiangensis]|uniref:Mycothiol acetyltransferase n=1 Tax=Kineococcus xinjiangensis TaxID=512762 RepID=A0A2S6ICW5_9ACTN|nr:mycothiol synthase [Kineococcus xinjiangensis]PPK92062.1 mycothiol synthase [Kineococcus xinjiangensis]